MKNVSITTLRMLEAHKDYKFQGLRYEYKTAEKDNPANSDKYYDKFVRKIKEISIFFKVGKKDYICDLTSALKLRNGAYFFLNAIPMHVKRNKCNELYTALNDMLLAFNNEETMITGDYACEIKIIQLRLVAEVQSYNRTKKEQENNINI